VSLWSGESPSILLSLPHDIGIWILPPESGQVYTRLPPGAVVKWAFFAFTHEFLSQYIGTSREMTTVHMIEFRRQNHRAAGNDHPHEGHIRILDAGVC
jgi:hypothetical protein